MENITYTFKEVCDITGYKPSVIRYYEKEFKLIIPRDSNGRRYFTQKVVEQLTNIKKLQQEGYTNSQIKKIIESQKNDGLSEAAITCDEAMAKIKNDNIAFSHNLEDNVIKYIDDKLREINNNLQELNQTVISKERDLIISENMKLKMELKQKAYEIMQLKESLNYERKKKVGFFSKIFRRKFK
jgi:DNA-binding transcriptional MerR regulator